MNSRIVVIIAVLIATAVGVPAVAATGNLSQGRGLGVGMEVGYPWGGLVSARYWFTPTIGGEGIIFVWGKPGDFTGAFTARLLYKVSDTDTTDFYLATGATGDFSPRGSAPLLFSEVGGIEFSFPFAPNLAINIEFGGAISTRWEISMAGGVGIHFYF